MRRGTSIVGNLRRLRLCLLGSRISEVRFTLKAHNAREIIFRKINTSNNGITASGPRFYSLT